MSEINKTPRYETSDEEKILPTSLHVRAIQFAKNATGINRPVKEHRVFIQCFKECFKAMQDLGMVRDDYK